MRSQHAFMLAAVIGMAVAGCGDRAITAPSPATSRPVPPPTVPAVPPNKGFAGHWHGTSIVEGVDGAGPDCPPPFWRDGFTDELTADLQGHLDSTDLLLQQQACNGCHLEATLSATGITARPWPYDELGCALVPSSCGPSSHFRLNPTGSCQGIPAPEIWITGAAFYGQFVDASQDRLVGLAVFTYDHRPAGSSPTTWWQTVSVRTRFDINRH